MQYTSADVTGVVSYEYAQRNHDTPWLITQMAFQPTLRVHLKRDQFALITPDGRRLPLASRKEMGAERTVVALGHASAHNGRFPTHASRSSP